MSGDNVHKDLGVALSPMAAKNMELRKEQAKQQIERLMNDPTRAYVGTSYNIDFSKGSDHE